MDFQVQYIVNNYITYREFVYEEVFNFGFGLPYNTYNICNAASYNSEIDVEAGIISSKHGRRHRYFDKNADMLTAPASLAKIVTASIVLENAQNLDEIVEVPNYAIRLLDGTNSPQRGFCRASR